MPRLLAWTLAAGALHVCACGSRPASHPDGGAGDGGPSVDGLGPDAAPDVADAGSTPDAGGTPDAAGTTALRNIDVTIIYPLPAAGDLDGLP